MDLARADFYLIQTCREPDSYLLVAGTLISDDGPILVASLEINVHATSTLYQSDS